MSNDSQVTVSRTIDASAADIFAVLSDPRRHPELDGSGFVRGPGAHADRVQQVGDVFSMDMEGDHMGGEYVVENHVSGFVPNQLIAWKTAPAGTEPPGWEWLYELKGEGPDSTEVTLTYDWSKVTDQALLKKVGFPLVKPAQLEDSLAKLATAVAS